MSPARPGSVVIGVGNPVCGDDAAGLEVARRRARARGPAVRVLELGGRAERACWRPGQAADRRGRHRRLRVRRGAGHRAALRCGRRRRSRRGSADPPPMRSDSPTRSSSDARSAGSPRRLTVYGIEGRDFVAGTAPGPAVAGGDRGGSPRTLTRQKWHTEADARGAHPRTRWTGRGHGGRDALGRRVRRGPPCPGVPQLRLGADRRAGRLVLPDRRRADPLARADLRARTR